MRKNCFFGSYEVLQFLTCSDDTKDITTKRSVWACVGREISELVRLYTGVKVDMSKALKGTGKKQKKAKKKAKKKAAKGQGGKGEL